MQKDEFKVLDWLRTMRDEHSKNVLNKPWETVHQETIQVADEIEKQIEEQRKRNLSLK